MVSTRMHSRTALGASELDCKNSIPFEIQTEENEKGTKRTNAFLPELSRVFPAGNDGKGRLRVFIGISPSKVRTDRNKLPTR